MKSVRDLMEELNTTDETTTIEAKKGSAIDTSVMETICAYCNEPNIEGGYILLGVEREETSLFPSYVVTGVDDPDKIQLDLSTQAATLFSQPIRPKLDVEEFQGKKVIRIWIDELAAAQKPVYFKRKGLPSGAYRRIGSSDQKCTEDDLILFYNHNETFDGSIVKDSDWEDIDENALSHYRILRAKINESAEELTYTDEDLLLALNCVKRDKGQYRLTVVGLHLFGSKMAQRRLCPAIRVDYIRVPGNKWVADPDNRFTTIDMRGPLLLTIMRVYNAVVDDLPKGFLLPEGDIQAQSVGLPGRVLREALVNAVMHRSYRVNQPIQIIRYGNRLEIKNPGYSLKSEESLGEPGSQQRNPFVAAVFHETNLAETKGSGIRTMRSLMERSGMVLPTFESQRSENMFTTRLLLHHLLSEEDLVWLEKFEKFSFNEDQKKALVFVREVGAIDNATYRQISGTDILKASTDLRSMKGYAVLEAKGKGRATYYVSGKELNNRMLTGAPTGSKSVDKKQRAEFLPRSAPPQARSAPPQAHSAPPLQDDLPEHIKTKVAQLGKRAKEEEVKEVIVTICAWKPKKSAEIASILEKSEKYVLRKFLTPLRNEGRIHYTIPDMTNHPDQAYKV